MTVSYQAPIPVLAISTDASGNYALQSSNVAISPDGMLTVPGEHTLAEQAVLGGFEFTSTGTRGSNYVLQSCASLQPPVQWVPVETNVADTNGVVQCLDLETNPVSSGRFYRLVTP